MVHRNATMLCSYIVFYLLAFVYMQINILKLKVIGFTKCNAPKGISLLSQCSKMVVHKITLSFDIRDSYKFSFQVYVSIPLLESSE